MNEMVVGVDERYTVVVNVRDAAPEETVMAVSYTHLTLPTNREV